VNQGVKGTVVEHEGKMIPFAPHAKLKDKEIMDEKQRKRDEKEAEEARLLAIQRVHRCDD